MRGSLGISGWSIGDYATEPVGLWQLESSRRTREMCGRIPRERHRAGSAAARSPDGRKWGHAHQAGSLNSLDWRAAPPISDGIFHWVSYVFVVLHP